MKKRNGIAQSPHSALTPLVGPLSLLFAIVRIATATNLIVPARVPEAEIDVAANTSIAALKRNNDEDYVHAVLQDFSASEL